MKNKNILIGCGIVAFMFMMMMVLVAMVVAVGRRGDSSRPGMKTVFSSARGKERIGLLYVNGTIHAGRSASGFMSESSSGSDSIVKLLRKANKNDKIKAIVVRVNSPGGSAAGSQEIYEEMMKIRKKGDKKITVTFGDVAASGGYYVASAADTIYSNAATLTGSIGVIMSYLNWAELMEKLGMTPVVLTAGEHKDMGSPYRALTDVEEKMLKDMLANIHEQFITDVAKGRGMDVEDVRKLADGRVYTGTQAMAVNLVDHIGGLQDAIEFAATEAGLDLPPQVEVLQKDNPFSGFLESIEGKFNLPLPENAIRKITQSTLLNRMLLTQ